MKEKIKLFGTIVLTLICSALLGITIVNAESVASKLTIKSSDYTSTPMSFPQTFHVKKTTSGKWAYCITYAKKTPYSGVTYTKNDIVDERGKYYILKEAAKNVDSNKDFFIYQTALWIYMSDKGIMSKSNSVSTFRSKVYNSSSSTAKKIRSIVSEAKKSPKIDKSAPSIKLSVSDKEMTLSGKNYVSKKIKLTSSTSKYDLSLSDAPKGSTYKVSGGYVYVYVPADKVTKMNDTVKLTAKNSKTVYNIYNYKPSNSKYQKMAVAFPEIKKDSASITLNINRKVNIAANKTDEAGKAISGAVLQVKNSNGTVIDKWTSNGSNHTVKNLTKGSYQLVEVTPPNGYKLNSTPVKFSIDDKGKLKNSSGNVITVVSMKNNKTDVEISKQAVTGTSELPGATLILKDANGTVRDKWVSGTTTHHVKGLGAGTYSLTEEIAPNGYKVSTETIKFTLDKNGNLTDASGKAISKVVMKNALTDVEISKQDITGSSELPGATLILSKNGTEVEKWVSGTTSHHVKGLSAGTYTLTEKIAPNGYVLSEEKITFTLDKYGKLTDKNGKAISKVVMKNTKTDVEISKQAITGGSEIPGATLILSKNGTEVEKWVSGTTSHHVKGLSAGTYTLTEKIAPDGYILSEETITFTLDQYGKLTDKGGNAIDKVVMKNALNEVKISKQDITTNKELAGATLVLSDSKGTEVESWVSTSDVHVIKGLKAGTYTLSETITPKGYVETKETVKFTIDEYGKLTDNNGKKIDKVVMYNTPQKEVKIRISKQDITNNKPVAGAALTLVDSNNNVVATWVSTEEDYYVENLEPGIYTLTETQAPSGYIKSEEGVKFTLDKSGKLTDEAGKEIEKVVIYNKPTDELYVEISKQDIATSKELPGAKLVVKDANGTPVDEWTSSSSSHIIKGIKAGTYTLTETEAPTDYVLSGKAITFTIDENGKLTNAEGKEVNKIVMYNEHKQEKNVKISKQDIATSKELPGARLIVKDADGNPVDEWTSSTEVHEIKDIKAGTYTLTEIQAPTDYELSEEKITFTIDENGKLTDEAGNKIDKVVMFNKKIPKTNVEISKQDITTSKELPGAKLVVKDANGTPVDEWTSSSESHIIKGLTEGTYTLSETQAPENYILKTETITFKIDKDGKLLNAEGKAIDKVIMYNEKEIVPFKVPIVKQDAKTHKNIEGAELKVTDATGKPVDTWTTKAEAHYIELTEGTYTLSEVSAPLGYVLNTTPIIFNVTADGKLTDVNGKSINSVVLDNTPVETQVSISKQDITNGKEIPGAKLVVKDANGNVVDTWTSTTTPHLITGLVSGNYTLNEVIAPNGYILSDETVPFTVKADGSVTSVVMYNSPKLTPTTPVVPKTPEAPKGEEIKVENTASYRTVIPTLFGGLSMILGTFTITKKRKREDLL